jgi:transcriptional regulator with XRE-family HTH domain
MSMINGLQIRMARAALGLSLQELAVSAGLSEKTIRRLEADGRSANASMKTINALKSALEAAGIEFIGTPDNRPGIRINIE